MQYEDDNTSLKNKIHEREVLRMISTKSTISRRLLTVLLAAMVAIGFTVTMPSIANAAGTNPVNAEKIPFNKDVYDTAPAHVGSASSGGAYQYHYYKIKTENMSGVTYTVKLVATGNYDVKGELLDSDYKTVETSKGYLYLDPSAGTGETAKYNLKKNREYYIRINTNEYNNRDRAQYMLRVQKNISKPGKPAIDYLKAGKKKFTIKYYKAKYATKYQVRYKVKGTSWGKAKNVGKKLKYTKKSLRSGKKYSVQVRAIRTLNGKDYIGKWSKTKTVKVK